MQWAEACSYHVAHMPLSKENRAKFNEQAAQEYFFQMEGLPYGNENYLFGWLDTPRNNTPVIFPSHLFVTVIGLKERMNKNYTDIMFSNAMNLRLGTRGLNISELAAGFATKNMTLMQAGALPERDEYIYNGQYHDGPSRVCSSFVVDLWNQAGLFEGYEIQSVEFTPRDIYQL